MLKSNKSLLSYLLALVILVSQCSIVFAEYEHKFHKVDCKCTVCLVADHLSHAVASSHLTLDIDHYTPLHSIKAVVFHTFSFTAAYLIRGPPLA
jgi:hypothetical protein